MNRLRNRLIAVFVAATVVPLAATLWITSALLERSLSYSKTDHIDTLSQALQQTGRELYNRSRQALKSDAEAGRVPPVRFRPEEVGNGPAQVREFWESGDPERFVLTGEGNTELTYLLRHKDGVACYSRALGVSMEALSDQFREARELVAEARARDLRSGFIKTFIVLAAGVWLLSLALLVYLAHRISRPIHQLTAGLGELADGKLGTRIPTVRNDEIGQAIQAFNETAAQLEQSRDRLVYLAQLASWQALARKMAHEIKNSLTPIRLTMEEIAARGDERDPAFLEQASRIIVEEVDSLQRRVRAFSEFAAEPAVRPVALDINAAVEERIAFLGTGHPEVRYNVRLAEGKPAAWADEDLVKGILTNLLENAAQAAGNGGSVLAMTADAGRKVAIEIHDSGSGLSEEARRSLFEPTISFKKGGMGLGLSIARKNALLLGGDILLVNGQLGGAGFRVTLPAAATETR